MNPYPDCLLNADPRPNVLTDGGSLVISKDPILERILQPTVFNSTLKVVFCKWTLLSLAPDIIFPPLYLKTTLWHQETLKKNEMFALITFFFSSTGST